MPTDKLKAAAAAAIDSENLPDDFSGSITVAIDFRAGGIRNLSIEKKRNLLLLDAIKEVKAAFKEAEK